MLSPQLRAEAEEPNGRGAPDTRQDEQKRRCWGATTGQSGQVRPRNSL
jgi:hypothetical protein